MQKQASMCAANFLPANFHNLELAKSGQSIFVEFDCETSEFHFYAKDDEGNRIEIKLMPDQDLILNTDSIPSELQPMLEVGAFSACHLTDDLRIKFNYESDRPDGIELKEFAVPGISFTAL